MRPPGLVAMALTVAGLAAAPALAEGEGGGVAPMEWLGGQGCTYGDALRADAQAAGVALAQLDTVILQGLSDGTATRHGDWVVFDAATCTISLPQITAPLPIDAPEVVAITSAIDAHDDEFGATGCFVRELSELFDRRAGGGNGSGWQEHIDFVAAHIIAGDLRFYATSPLSTPVAFQVVTGDCADVPYADGLRRSHADFEARYAKYVRGLFESQSCDGSVWLTSPMEIAARLQGFDPATAGTEQPSINAWAFFEYDLVAMAAGLFDGMGARSRGDPRPPLCHYPQ